MKDKRTFDISSSNILRSSGSERAELLEFTLLGKSNSESRFLVNIAKVQDVRPCPQIIRTPNSSASVPGNIVVKNETVPLLDLSAVFGSETSQSNKIAKSDVIVLSLMGSRYAVLVHQVVRIHYALWTEIIAPGSHAQPSIVGLVKVDEQMIQLLNFEQLLNDVFDLGGNSVTQAASTPLENVCLAVIDDSHVIGEQVRTIFAKNGAKVDAFTSGHGFLDSQKNLFQTYPHIVVDIEMPGMDGISLVKRLRGDNRYDQSSIYVYSSIDIDLLRNEAKTAGANAYIVKKDIADLWDAVVRNHRLPKATSFDTASKVKLVS